MKGAYNVGATCKGLWASTPITHNNAETPFCP